MTMFDNAMVSYSLSYDSLLINNYLLGDFTTKLYNSYSSFYIVIIEIDLIYIYFSDIYL